MLTLDRDEARRTLKALGIEKAHFQTLDDSKARDSKDLVRCGYGAFDEYADRLESRNRLGAGVFFTPNQTHPGPRNTSNVTAVRALFVDLDGAAIEPVLAWELQPDLVVESSRGRFHAYWRTDGSVPLDEFEPLQKKLAALFNGDAAVHDLPRVMRLPGSWHQKVSRDGKRSEPFMARIARDSSNEW
jgi:putative DNA primase/helicase